MNAHELPVTPTPTQVVIIVIIIVTIVIIVIIIFIIVIIIIIIVIIIVIIIIVIISHRLSPRRAEIVFTRCCNVGILTCHEFCQMHSKWSPVTLFCDWMTLRLQALYANIPLLEHSCINNQQSTINNQQSTLNNQLLAGFVRKHLSAGALVYQQCKQTF